MSWHERAVAELIELKRAGHSWEYARTRVMASEPRVKSAHVYNPRLFALTGEDTPEETVEEAAWRYFEDAWHGRKPKLREFSLETLRDSAWDAPARHRGMVA